MEDLITDKNSCELKYTMFEDQFAKTMRTVESTWPGFVDLVKSPNVVSHKAAAPWFKMAEFNGKHTPKGCLRHDNAVSKLYGIEGDYDAGKMSIEEAAKKLADADITCVLYTSGSHTEEHPKWRVVAPLSKSFAAINTDLNRKFRNLLLNLRRM